MKTRIISVKPRMPTTTMHHQPSISSSPTEYIQAAMLCTHLPVRYALFRREGQIQAEDGRKTSTANTGALILDVFSHLLIVHISTYGGTPQSSGNIPQIRSHLVAAPLIPHRNPHRRPRNHPETLDKPKLLEASRMFPAFVLLCDRICASIPPETFETLFGVLDIAIMKFLCWTSNA